jgi:hypothetical protein
MIKISEIYIYPVKSLAGIAKKQVELSPFGLMYDRRWMIVDAKGRFITQREHFNMATINTAIKEEQLILSHAGDSIVVPACDAQAEQLKVTVWKDTFIASLVSTEVDQWLSQILDQPCHLVYMSDQVKRQVDPDFAPIGQNVSFADGYPILVISQESLNNLNAKLTEPVNINRFRPNLVTSGAHAFAEDDWNDLSIQNIEFNAVKKCSRCIMPSINQQSGEQDQVKMLATLNTYRKQDKKIKFGQNLIYKDVDLINRQIISCGDEVILT